MIDKSRVFDTFSAFKEKVENASKEREKFLNLRRRSNDKEWEKIQEEADRKWTSAFEEASRQFSETIENEDVLERLAKEAEEVDI